MASNVLSLATRLVQALPDQVSEALAGAVGEAVYLGWRSKRWTARRNYAVVLEADPQSRVVARTTRAAFRNHARWVLGNLRLPRSSGSDLKARLVLQRVDYLEEAARSDRGMILVSAHFGRPELAMAVLASRGQQVTTVGEAFAPAPVFKWITEAWGYLGVTMLPVEGSALTLARTLRRSGTVALLVDVGAGAPDAVEVEFFGRSTLFPSGPAALARLTGAPIVPGYVRRLPGRRFEAVVLPPILPQRTADAGRDILVATQAVAHALESFIGAYPEQWYMFRPMWRPEA